MYRQSLMLSCFRDGEIFLCLELHSPLASLPYAHSYVRRGNVYKNECLKAHLKRSLFIRVMAQVGKQEEQKFACA